MSTRQKLIGIIVFTLLATNSFSQVVVSKSSLTGLFTYKIPSDWTEEKKTHPSVVEYVQYISKNGEYLMISVTDVYYTILSSVDRSKYSRIDLSYNKYSGESRKAAFDGFIKSYIGTLTYKALKLIESRIDIINGTYCNYALFSYLSADGNQKYQINYEILVQGYSIKFSYGYIFSKEVKSLPIIKDLIKTIKFI